MHCKPREKAASPCLQSGRPSPQRECGLGLMPARLGYDDLSPFPVDFYLFRGVLAFVALGAAASPFPDLDGVLLWFQAKRRFGILLAKGHDGRVEIFRINPGGFSLWMLIKPRHSSYENTVLNRRIRRIASTLGSKLFRSNGPLPAQTVHQACKILIGTLLAIATLCIRRIMNGRKRCHLRRRSGRMERNRAIDSLESRSNRNVLEINYAECHDAANNDQHRYEYRQQPCRKMANGRGPSPIPVVDL